MSIPDGHGDDFWIYVVDAVMHLDTLTYYQLLGVTPDADMDTINRAYYELARRLHPDRHIRESSERQRALTKLYARMGEAYRALRTTSSRAAYDKALAGGAQRLTADAEAREKQRAQSPDPKTPKARAMYERGRELLHSGDRRGARAQWSLAAQFEPDSKVLREALAELDAGDAAPPAQQTPSAPARPSQPLPAARPSQPLPAARPSQPLAAARPSQPLAAARPSQPLAAAPASDYQTLAARAASAHEYPGICHAIAVALEHNQRDHRLRALWYAALARQADMEGRARDALLHRQTAFAFDRECPALGT